MLAMANTPLRDISSQQISAADSLISPQSISHKRLQKRRSAGLNFLHQTPNLPESVEDEVHALRQRRHSRNFSSVIPLADQTAETEKLPSAKWSKDKLLQHYSECMKLSQENKINHKNAFDLQLIEHMGEMIQQDGSLNFRVAGGTIFAGAKIYASRVDAIHSEMYRVLSSLSSADKDDNLPDEDNNDDPEKKVKKRKKNSKILETTESNLRIQSNNGYSMEEARSRSHYTAIDAANSDSLMLNQGNTNSDCSMLQYDFESLPTVDNIPNESSSIVTSQFRNILPPGLASSVKIPEIFNEFTFNQSATDSTAMDTTDTIDIDDRAYAPSCDDTVDNDVGSIPGEEESLPDACDDSEPAFDSQTETVSKTKPIDPSSAANVTDLVAIAPPAEYSYFKPNTFTVCEGPGHWMRPRNLRTGLSSTAHKEGDEDSLQPVKAKRRKTLKEKRNLWENGKLVIDKKLQPQKTSKAKLESLRKNVQDQLLLEYPDRTTECLLRARLLKVVLRRLPSSLAEQSRVALTGSNAIDNFKYDNDEFCPASTVDDYDNSADLFSDNTECFFPDFTQNITSHDDHRDAEADYNALLEGDHLLNHPRKMEKVQVHFAKRAKRIDVRKLKSAMWKLIKPMETSDEDPTTDHESPERPEDKDNSTAKTDQPDDSLSPSSGSQLFSDVYSHLPGKVSKNMMENMSIPLAFTCLLHLANEKQLKIEGTSTLKDLKITQDL